MEPTRSIDSMVAPDGLGDRPPVVRSCAGERSAQPSRADRLPSLGHRLRRPGLADARRDVGSCRRVRRLRCRLDERSPLGRQPGARRGCVRAVHDARGARAPRSRPMARRGGRVGHVPPSGAARQGRDRARQRHRRPVHPGRRRRLARGGARRVRDPASTAARAIRSARGRPSDDLGPVRTRCGTRTRRHAWRTPSTRCAARPTSRSRCVRVARRSGSVASDRGGSGWPCNTPRAGRCPGIARATSPTSRRSATRSVAPSRERDAIRTTSPSPRSSTRGRPLIPVALPSRWRGASSRPAPTT